MSATTLRTAAPAGCQSCGFENPPDSRYCGACGAALNRRCPGCGTDNPPRFNFCGTCGSPLAMPETAPEPARTPEARRPQPGSRDRRAGPRAPQAERRQLTVMFCDIVGSTPLSLALDPEILREVIRSYQSVCAEAIERFGGYVAQYLGDGVLVYFGYPVALENEAERAVRAGLEVLAGVDRLNAQLARSTDIRLGVRIGVHTGLVVVGEIGGGLRREHLALGGAPNIAARLQASADPDTLVVSGETHRLVARTFECVEVGESPLKGVVGGGQIYRVVRERETELIGAGVAPDAGTLIGRDAEMEQLLEAWRQASTTAGRAVVIIGDPGIGKSHLMREFRRRVEKAPAVRLEFRCQPYYQNSPFHPFIELLQRRFDLGPEHPAEDRLSRIEALLEAEEFPLADTVPLFASLLSVPLGGRYEPVAQGPQAQKERTRAALLRLLVRAATDQPMLLLGEDLHWADPSTLELIDLLFMRVADTHMLALLTSRPGNDGRWSGRDAVDSIALGRLAQADVERIVGRTAGGSLPPEVLQQVVERTDGVPLFAEELTKMVLESGMLRAEAGGWSLEGQLPALAIPATLQDSLEARLERFATVKEVAQLAATLGREFNYAQLNAVAYVDEPVLLQSLEQLVEAQLVYQEGDPPRAAYTFKHALLQEAAYQSLLRSTRLRHHQRIARTFETQFPDVAALQPELLAHHWAAAGMHGRAIPYWQRAGMRAMQASANAEAVAHLTRGVEALANLEEGPERNRIELQLQASLGTAYTATRGHASKEVRAAFSRARELSQRVGDTPYLSQVLAGLFAFYYVRGDLETARELGVDLLELAGRLGDADIALVGHAGLSIAKFAVGDGRSARPHFDYVINAYEMDRHAPLAVTHGQDFLVVALVHAAQLDWVEGYPDRALAHSRAAVAHAEKLGHAQSLAMALTAHGSMHCFRREVRETKDAAADLMKLTTEQELAHWGLDALFLQAWVLAQRGQRAAAAERADQAASSYGLETHLPRHRFDIFLTETYRTLARPDEALRIVEASEADRQRRGVPGVWEPDIWRLHGELLAELGANDEARRWLERAVAEANRRHARMLELRALISLVRLDDRQGLRSDATSRLESLYATFTEGFDHPDLADCRSLIDTFADSGAA